MSAVPSTLRRWEGCFAGALMPSLVLGLLFLEGVGVSISEHPIAMTFSVVVAIAAAYAAYAIRRWLRDDSAKKQQRLLEKTPIERSRRQQDLFTKTSSFAREAVSRTRLARRRQQLCLRIA